MEREYNSKVWGGKCKGSQLAGILLLIVLSQSLPAQPNQTNYLYGTVTDELGEPLIGVNLVIGSSQNFTGTVTRTDGSYKFESLHLGSHILKATYLGYKTLETTITISKGKPTHKNIQLKSKSLALSDILVTAKSATTQIKEQSFEIETIPTKGLENSVGDAKSLLSGISGVRIAEDGGMGSNSSFSLNGFSGSQVKFFLDGIPMDNFGSSLSLGDLPVNMIKHIEVYKGVVPIWLGNDALGGAVNIISHNTPNYLDLSYSYGSFHSHRVSVNGSISKKNGLTFRANLFYNYSDNDYNVFVAKGNGDNQQKWYPRFHDSYTSATAKFEIGTTNKKYADQLLFGIIATGNNKQQQTGATMAKVYGEVFSESMSQIGTLKYKKQNLFAEGLDVRFYGAYIQNESHYVDSSHGMTYSWDGSATSTPRSNNGEIGQRSFTIFKVKELTGQFNASYAFFHNSTLSFNYALSDYHRTVSDSLNPENENNFFPKDMLKHNLGISYKYEWKKRWATSLFAKYYRLEAQTSKRFDRFLQTERIEKLTDSQNNRGYGLATSYFVLPQLQLKLSYEKAYRMPSPMEMFGDGLFVNPNPDLEPETSDNVNLSSNLSKTVSKHHKLNLSASFLYRNASDLIYPKISPGSPLSSYANSLKIRFLGTEANARYEYKDYFHLNANLSYQEITDRAEEIQIKQASGNYWQKNYSYGFRLPNRPYLFGKLNTGVGIKNWVTKDSKLTFDYYLNFTEQYFLTWVEMGTNNSKYTIPRQWSHDIQLNYSFMNGRYNISAQCTNIFNDLLYDKYFLQKPGRAFNVKLRLTI